MIMKRVENFFFDFAFLSFLLLLLLNDYAERERSLGSVREKGEQ